MNDETERLQERHFLASDEDVDLRNLSIDEMRRVNNPVLRDVLLAAKEALHEQSSSHSSHGTHTNHSESMTDGPL